MRFHHFLAFQTELPCWRGHDLVHIWAAITPVWLPKRYPALLRAQKLDLVKKQISEADDVIVNQRRELEKLNRIINEADQELARQQKEYDIVINERDILGQQLIKRNQELAKVYERIKVQQSLLASGQVHYRERVRESTALQSRITMLRAELEALKTSVSGEALRELMLPPGAKLGAQRSQTRGLLCSHADIGGLRNETHKLRRELLREQIKVKALQEELMVPMNVHRWRKLEGSDPETFERIQLIQSLQRKLIGKTEEVLEKDLLIQEKEKLYLELKSILARQPGPEVSCRRRFRVTFPSHEGSCGAPALKLPVIHYGRY